jgi:hypothetical protein
MSFLKLILRQAGVPVNDECSLSFIKRIFYAIFSNLHIKYMFFTNKIILVI